jgi:hypothetical protein
MELFLLLALSGGLVAVVLWWQRESSARRQREVDDAAAEAHRWYERLSGQVMMLSGTEPAVAQALADAGERYNAAGSQLARARTTQQFRLAQESALEGLMYTQAARAALGLDPGPEVPPPASARGAGQLTKEREVQVEGQTFKAGPRPGDDTPHYYPGGRVDGRPVPAGWYSQPLWKPAFAGAAGAMAGVLVLNTLLAPSFADPGYLPFSGDTDGFGDGFGDGINDGDGFGGSDFGGGDFGGDFGGGGVDF